MISNFAITGLYPRSASTLTTVYSGTFDASGVFITAVVMGYQNGVAYNYIVYFFLAVVVCFALRSCFLLPVSCQYTGSVVFIASMLDSQASGFWVIWLKENDAELQSLLVS